MVYRHSPLQLPFESFGAGLSTPLSSNNEWVQLAEAMPWKALDEAYQLEFTKNAGRAAKPFRLLYGAILIQQRMGLTDRGVVAAIRDRGQWNIHTNSSGRIPNKKSETLI